MVVTIYRFAKVKPQMNEMDPDPSQMDLDPSLSLTAEGLWSDEESLYNPNSDSDDPDLATSTPSAPAKRKGRRRKHEISPPPQIKNLLSHATSLYASGDLTTAKDVVKEIIQTDSECFQAYTLLSHIHEDMGSKVEAVNALVSAAMLTPRDANIWIRAARMSRELGFWQQAIRCYDTGVRLESGDLNVIYERSIIHAEHGSAKKAIDGFTTILNSHPMDMTVTRDLAKVYNNNGRNREAVELYQSAKDYYMSLPQQIKPDGDLNTPFDWNELNIFLGLISDTSIDSIRIIHRTSRWLRGRSSETFWDDFQDSREWDEDDTRRSHVAQYTPGEWNASRYSLPMEIRVRLGISWLRIQNLPEAMKQFEVLEKADVETFPDLYWDVSEALQAHSHPAEALHYYAIINDHDQYNGPVAWAAMGRCYIALNESQQAEECYAMCARVNPTDYDSRLRLAEILELTNRKTEAMEIIAAVKRDRDLYQQTDTIQPETSSSGALIPNSKRMAPVPIPSQIATFKPRNKPQHSERAAVEARLKEIILTAWGRLETLRPGMESGNKDDVDQWMSIAKGLIDDFRSIKSFFPVEKGRRITWFDEDQGNKPGPGRKRKFTDIESRVEEIEMRLQEQMQEERDVEMEVEERDLSKEVFRGLEFEQWFYLFMQYALLLAQYDSLEKAEVILKSAYDANVFFQTPRLMRILNTIYLACTIHVGAVADSSFHVKRFLQSYQFRSDAYRLYYLALGTGHDACEQFHSPVDQKYLLRQIKALDGLLSGETIVGSASIVEEPDIEKCVPKHANPVLLTLYGHRLAAGGSFSAAQLREFIKEDALLELSIGLAYLHRSMQRQVNNRHISILQAMTFIFQYYRLQYTKSQNYDGIDGATVRQQAEYNVARAFHQVGLETFAVKYYENALRISEEFEGGLGRRDLKFEAAHNLSLIFQLSGNIQASREITEKFLVL